MFWIIPALAGLAIVYFAARFSRFRRFAEPVVSLAVAIGLLAAFVVFLIDDRDDVDRSIAPTLPTVSAIAAEDIVLSDIVITQGATRTTYHLTATIENRSGLPLDSFTLAVTMQDCPNDICTPIGTDEALILARLAAGRSENIRTTLTFPVSTLSPPTAVRWSQRIEKIRAAR